MKTTFPEETLPSRYWLLRFTKHGSPKASQAPPLEGSVARLSPGRDYRETRAEYRQRIAAWVDHFDAQPAHSVVLVEGWAPRPVLEAIGRLRSLRALFVKDCGIESFDFLQDAPELKYLHLNYADRLADISALARSTSLAGLGLVASSRVRDHGPLRELPRLRQLRLGFGRASEPVPVSLDTIVGDGEFHQFELRQLRPDDGDWSPLTRLRGLRDFLVPRDAPRELIREVYANNPRIRSKFAWYLEERWG